MNADKLYIGMSRAQQREKLMDLVERKKSWKRRVPKERDTTDIKNHEKESTKRKKLNAHFYKMLFKSNERKVKVSNDVNDTPAKR